MSSIAKYLFFSEFIVSGSDKSNSNTLLKLKKLGIKVFVGHKEENVYGVDAVVYSSAIEENNPELLYAKQNGIRVVKRGEILGEILNNYKYSIAVSGCHGKTTTTSIIAHILKCAYKNITSFIGGEDKKFNNFTFGSSQYCVAEACEYKRNFLYIKPYISVVLNIDNDHPDTYKNIDETIEAFNCFIKNSISVVNIDDKNTQKLSSISQVSISINENAMYRAKNIIENERELTFSVYKYNKYFGRFTIELKGKYNVYNALSSIAVCDILGIDKKTIRRGLKDFCGIKRRAEFLGEILNGTKCYADYAHHPSEIEKTIETFNGENKDTLIIFQPHTFSRTKALKKDFIDVLNICYNLAVYKTYPAREKYEYSGSAKCLFKNLDLTKSNAIYIKSKIELINFIKKEGKLFEKIIFIGAGDIYNVAQKIIKKLKN